MEPDGQSIIRRKIKKAWKISKLLIIIMMLLINNCFSNCYATTIEDITDYETEENTGVFATIKKNVLNTLNIKVNGYAITIQDNTFGYVESKEQRDDILKKVCARYIKQLNNICEGEKYLDVEVEVGGKLEATPEKIKISEMSESNEIASGIYEASVIDKDLLDLEFKVSSYNTVEFEPEVIVQNEPELYMGESKTIDGVNGKKIIYKEETFSGFTKLDENILSEDILEEAIPTVVQVGTKNPYYDGIAFLMRPTVGGYLSSQYGEVRGASYHKGIDIAKNLGEDVYAALDGEVISAGYNNGGYGNLIIVDHGNGVKTYYAHLSEILVNVGDYIKKGNTIGAIGSTGYSTGPHLHFELRINDVPVDPTNYIIE